MDRDAFSERLSAYRQERDADEIGQSRSYSAKKTWNTRGCKSVRPSECGGMTMDYDLHAVNKLFRVFGGYVFIKQV